MKRFRTCLAAGAALLLAGCVILPYYKELPYLPAVSGFALDEESGEPVADALVYWKGEGGISGSSARTGADGGFSFPVLNKYVKWKLVAMDPGWGGILVFEKEGYEPKEFSVGGMGREFRVEARLSRKAAQASVSAAGEAAAP